MCSGRRSTEGASEYYAAHWGSPHQPTDAVEVYRRSNSWARAVTLTSWQTRWDTRLVEIHRTLGRFRTVHLLGASTKANTFLQMAELGWDRIQAVWERHPAKIGRTTVTGIPIITEEEGRAAAPDLLVCGIWQFKDQILEREQEYLAGGGKIYFPFPAGEVYGGIL